MLNLGKVKNDIADLTNKKETLLLSLQRDVEVFEKQLAEVFQNVGEEAYKIAKESKASFPSLEESFTVIDELLENISAKNKKKTDVAMRYDEEIEILEKLIPEAPPEGEKKFCPACGKEFTDEDVFCDNCGTKL